MVTYLKLDSMKNIDYNFLALLSFEVLLTVAIVVLLRGKSSSTTSALPPLSSSHEKRFELDVPVFKHRLTIPDRETGEELQDLLKKEGIDSVIQNERETLNVCFTSREILTNAESLKKKGILVDFDIRREKA